MNFADLVIQSVIDFCVQKTTVTRQLCLGHGVMQTRAVLSLFWEWKRKIQNGGL